MKIYMGVLYWSYFNLGRKSCFHRNKMNTDLMVTNIEDKNSLNNEEREILINAVPNAKIPINIEQQKVKETNSMV